MNKIKMFILFILLTLLSGCTATYELTINDKTIKENLTLVELNTEVFDVRSDSGWTLRETVDAALNDDEFSKELYTTKSLNNDTQLGIKYSSSKLDSVLNSSVLNQCYIDPKVTQSNDVISIDTGTNFQCYDFYDNLDNIRVILRTNHKVISTNSDEKNNNEYVWNITKDGNKQIEFSYSNSIVNKNFILYILVGVALIIVCLSILLYIKTKKKNVNSI